MGDLRPQTAADDEAVRRFEEEPDSFRLTSRRGVEVEAVTIAAQTVREDEAHLEAAVVAARRSGASWRMIGAAAGMTRQGATQRWGRVDPVAATSTASTS